MTDIHPGLAASRPRKFVFSESGFQTMMCLLLEGIAQYCAPV